MVQPASLLHDSQGFLVCSKRLSTSCSSLERERLMFKCFGPVSGLILRIPCSGHPPAPQPQQPFLKGSYMLILNDVFTAPFRGVPLRSLLTKEDTPILRFFLC